MMSPELSKFGSQNTYEASWTITIRQQWRHLIPQNGPIPKNKNDENIFRFCDVQKFSDFGHEGSVSVGSKDEAVGVKMWAVVTLDVKPNTWMTERSIYKTL